MSAVNADQRDFWTDDAGHIWVAQMSAMDAALAPVLDLVLSRAGLQQGETVVDIGCGAGTSTHAAGAQVGATGRVLGVDISETLLAQARQGTGETSHVSFTLGDAQTYAFAPKAADALISRFGVMFFEDSAAAFRNMARGIRPGGRMVFATWGEIPENPYFTLPAAVSKSVLGPVPKSDPDAPGPFALRDISRVTGILETAGLKEITAEAVPLQLTPVGTARQVAELMCVIGPAQRALEHHAATDAERAALIDALEEALASHETEDGVRIPALINLFEARTA